MGSYRDYGTPTHAFAARDTPGIAPVACTSRLHYVGPVPCRQYRDNATLYCCTRCQMLVAVYLGQFAWTTPVPPAVALRGGGPASAFPTDPPPAPG